MELKVDQPIWVRLRSDMKWVKRHFCKFYDGKLYCWSEGKTSFTSTKYDDWNFFTDTEPEDKDINLAYSVRKV